MPESPTAFWLALAVAGPIVPELVWMIAVVHTGLRRVHSTQRYHGPDSPVPDVDFIAAAFEEGWRDVEPVAPPYWDRQPVHLVAICIHPHETRSLHVYPESILRASNFKMKCDVEPPPILQKSSSISLRRRCLIEINHSG